MDRPPPDDTAAVAAIRAGDSTAMGDLFDRYAPTLHTYAWRRLSDTPDRTRAAEDVVSLVFLEAWRVRERILVIEASARPWLLGIAANVIANDRRTRRRHAAALARFEGHAHATEAVAEAVEEAVIERLDGASQAAIALAAIADLTAKERVVADLCLVEGCSTSEAAAVLALPEGTVRSRLDRARRHLRAVLQTGDTSDPGTLSGHQVGRRAPRVPVEGSTRA